MKLKELTVSKKGKVSTGQWENEEPFIEMVFTDMKEGDITEAIDSVNKLYRDEVNKIKNPEGTVTGTVEAFDIKALVQEIMKIRFYEKMGIKLPSVTSVVNYKSKQSEFVSITPEKLMLLASRGNIIHKQVEYYIKTNEWCEPNTITECEDDLLMLEGTDIKTDDVNFLGYLEKYPIEKFISTEKAVYNLDELGYAGRQDIKCIYNGKVTLADLKTGSMPNERKIKTFAQLSAYAKCPSNEDVEQLLIIHLNHKTKQGFSAPIVTDEVDEHFEMFMKKRRLLKKEYGI